MTGHSDAARGKNAVIAAIRKSSWLSSKCIADLALPRSSRLEARFEPGLLGGTVVIRGQAIRRQKDKNSPLYQSIDKSRKEICRLQAIPYCKWANRRAGEMQVWIREE
ncbi:MAG: hypothetical protein PHV34_23545 [Verrucomicrobiae bacterium]|nr:hypothetical protein [Verrucomicrobiae bacterium]